VKAGGGTGMTGLAPVVHAMTPIDCFRIEDDFNLAIRAANQAGGRR
jgi:hypothetical protein